MQQIICTNNQFLRNIVSIPINGLLPTALNAEIDLNENEPKENKTKTTVYDYITDAEWYLGLEPTNCKGQYLLLTTHQQVQEARNWLDKNPEALFIKYITQYQTFTPIKGYDYPKRGNKPRFSHQLGNYANHLCAIYPHLLSQPQQTTPKQSGTNHHSQKPGLILHAHSTLKASKNTLPSQLRKPKEPKPVIRNQWKQQFPPLQSPQPQTPSTPKLCANR